MTNEIKDKIKQLFIYKDLQARDIFRMLGNVKLADIEEVISEIKNSKKKPILES
jgi:citrate lyase synthetase